MTSEPNSSSRRWYAACASAIIASVMNSPVSPARSPPASSMTSSTVTLTGYSWPKARQSLSRSHSSGYPSLVSPAT